MDVQGDGGFGLMGFRPNGGNMFERGVFWVFKILQLLVFWSLLQFVFDFISYQHIVIILVIALSYLAIDHFQKRKNQHQ